MNARVSDLFWVFLMVSLLLPIVQRWRLEAARIRTIRRIETERGSRLIALIHRQETVSFLGLPLFRFIDVEDAEQVIRAIHLTDPKAPIDILLHSPGGLVLASVQIARAVQAHAGKVTVLIPHYAMSGGTLIALAADEIIMDSHAVLGPVDPQIGELPAASLVKVVAEKPIDKIDDKTLVLADMAAKALQQIKTEIVGLLVDDRPAEEAERIAEVLSQGTWTHDHPIGFQEARALGLPVTSDLPRAVYELMELYPQPVRRQPAVQYIPLPYGPPSGPDRPVAK
jgi:ClpP class serine protease